MKQNDPGHQIVRTPDGHNIDLELLRTEGRRVVLCLHGITSEKSEGGLYRQLADRIRIDGLSTAMFDFRGHGASAIPFQDASVAGMVLDFVHVYDALSLRFDSVDLVCASFGASVALLATRAHALAKTSRVVLLNPVLSYRETFTEASTAWGKRFYPQLRDGQVFNEWRHPTGEPGLELGREMLTQLALLVPEAESFGDGKAVTIVHGTEDTVVPFEASKSYASHHCLSRNLLAVEGADHGFEGFEATVLASAAAVLNS